MALIWANRLYRKTGIRVVLTCTPDRKIYYSIINDKMERTDGVCGPIKEMDERTRKALEDKAT